MRSLRIALVVAVGLVAGCRDEKPVTSPSVASSPVVQSQYAITSAPASITRTETVRADPRQFASLQPFFVPAKGAGEGYAYSYFNRTKPELIRMLENPALMKKQSRISCERLVQQMAELNAHLNLPFEGCAGAAAALKSDDFKVEQCHDDMWRNSLLALTNDRGNRFGVWERQCMREGGKIVEQVLTYKGEPVMSMYCLNPRMPKTVQRVVTVSPPTAVKARYGLQVNCMLDRVGYWQSRYDTARAKWVEVLANTPINTRAVTPYREVFTSPPFTQMLSERKDRPSDCQLTVTFLKKEPMLVLRREDSAAVRAKKYEEYQRQLQYPSPDNILRSEQVSTGKRGWVIVPIADLSGFEVVTVQPEQLGAVMEPLISVGRATFQGQTNPIHVWEVDTR